MDPYAEKFENLSIFFAKITVSKMYQVNLRYGTHGQNTIHVSWDWFNCRGNAFVISVTVHQKCIKGQMKKKKAGGGGGGDMLESYLFSVFGHKT